MILIKLELQQLWDLLSLYKKDWKFYLWFLLSLKLFKFTLTIFLLLTIISNFLLCIRLYRHSSLLITTNNSLSFHNIFNLLQLSSALMLKNFLSNQPRKWDIFWLLIFRYSFVLFFASSIKSIKLVLGYYTCLNEEWDSAKMKEKRWKLTLIKTYLHRSTHYFIRLHLISLPLIIPKQIDFELWKSPRTIYHIKSLNKF